MATALNRFALDVLHDVPRAPGPIVEREIRYAAIEFCDFTLAWRYPLSDDSLVADTSEYTFSLPAESRVVTVIYAAQEGVRLLPTTERILDDEEDGWRALTSTQSEWYYLPDRTKIRVALTPSESGDALSITVALKPTQEAKNLPDILFDDNLEAIRAGALAKLLAKPGRDYSNPKLAAYYLQEFENAKRKEKAERWNDYTRQSSMKILPVDYTGA